MPSKKNLYDLDEIRAIPILDVCSYLGLPIEKRGKNYWCKVRPENNASVILHTDTNYFYDFGTCEHGNNIALVQYARGNIRVGEAIQELAKAFDLNPSESQEDSLAKPLTPWEYRKIGLHSDLATKNIIFPVEEASIEELLEIEHSYRMSMNQLRLQDPDCFQTILKTKAIPFVENKRNCFFLSVWKYFDFLQFMKRHDLFFDSERTNLKFEADTQDLYQSERALYKACQGTDITVAEPIHYDPQRVLNWLLSGRLSLPLGPLGLDALRDLAKEKQEGTCERTVLYGDYCNAELEDHIHSASLFQGKVNLSFPESEKEFYDRIFSHSREGKAPLVTVLLDAESRAATKKQKPTTAPEQIR